MSVKSDTPYTRLATIGRQLGYLKINSTLPDIAIISLEHKVRLATKENAKKIAFLIKQNRLEKENTNLNFVAKTI